MGYREVFFAHYPGQKRFGRRGLWYQCVGCGHWFSKSEITVDHRIPKRMGGTDHWSNLQPMCRSCNSSKHTRTTAGDYASTMVRAAFSGQLGSTVGNIAKRKVKDTFGIKYKRK